MRRLAAISVLLFLLVAPALAKGEKPEPRKTSKADQQRIEKERKAGQKKREASARGNTRESEALGKRLATLMEAWCAKGFEGAIVVKKGGQDLLRKGYGLAGREAKGANTAGTLDDCGSVTKLFTAAGMLRLEQYSKLKLADTLGKIFAFAPDDKKASTLTQLLSHTSGLSRMYSDEIDFMSRESTVKGLLGIKLSSEPGTKFEYSNSN